MRGVVDGRFFVGPFDFENDGAQAVVAAAYGYARLFDPVAVIELSAAVRQGENILVDGLPRFITEPVRLGVVGVKNLPFLEHRTLADSLGAVFLGQFLIKMPLEDGDPASFHVASVMCWKRRISLFVRFRNTDVKYVLALKMVIKDLAFVI